MTFDDLINVSLTLTTVCLNAGLLACITPAGTAQIVLTAVAVVAGISGFFAAELVFWRSVHPAKQ